MVSIIIRVIRLFVAFVIENRRVRQNVPGAKFLSDPGGRSLPRKQGFGLAGVKGDDGCPMSLSRLPYAGSRRYADGGIWMGGHKGV
jgi:hypothetical protein